MIHNGHHHRWIYVFEIYSDAASWLALFFSLYTDDDDDWIIIFRNKL